MGIVEFFQKVFLRRTQAACVDAIGPILSSAGNSVRIDTLANNIDIAPRAFCRVSASPLARSEYVIHQPFHRQLHLYVSGAKTFLPAMAMIDELDIYSLKRDHKKKWRKVKKFLAQHGITHLAELGGGSYSNAFLTNSGHVFKISQIDKGYHEELTSAERSHPAILAPIAETMLDNDYFMQILPRVKILEDDHYNELEYKSANLMLREELWANGMKAWDNHEGNFGLLPDGTLVWIDGGGVEKSSPSGDQPDSSPWLTERGEWRQHEFFPEIKAGEITNIITAQDLENWGIARDSNLAIAVLDYGLQGDDLLAVLGDETMAKPFVQKTEHGVDYLNIEDANENRTYLHYASSKEKLGQKTLDAQLSQAVRAHNEYQACRLLQRGAIPTLEVQAVLISSRMNKALQLGLQLGAISIDKELRNHFDDTRLPMILFAAEKNIAGAMLLLQAGADINTRTECGGFLFYAVKGAVASRIKFDELVTLITNAPTPISADNLQPDLDFIANHYGQNTANYFNAAMRPADVPAITPLAAQAPKLGLRL